MAVLVMAIFSFWARTIFYPCTMKIKVTDLRKKKKKNIKKHREMLGISQEKLAESTGMSSMMIKDIEGCRTWISDKTLIALAAALQTDIFRLFMPDTLFDEVISRTLLLDLTNATKKIKKDIEIDLNNTLKLWGMPTKS
jgi:transcriptional regulator with XRE-family HTH domain